MSKPHETTFITLDRSWFDLIQIYKSYQNRGKCCVQHDQCAHHFSSLTCSTALLALPGASLILVMLQVMQGEQYCRSEMKNGEHIGRVEHSIFPYSDKTCISGLSQTSFDQVL